MRFNFLKQKDSMPTIKMICYLQDLCIQDFEIDKIKNIEDLEKIIVSPPCNLQKSELGDLNPRPVGTCFCTNNRQLMFISLGIAL